MNNMKRTYIIFAMLLLIVAVTMSGCIEEGTNVPTTIVNNTTPLTTDIDTDKVMPEVPTVLVNKTPEVPTVLVNKTPEMPTVLVNETVICADSRVNVTYKGIDCAYMWGRDYRKPGTGEKIVKFYVEIEAIGNDTIETGLNDWQIIDADGRTYKPTPHDDAKSMKKLYQIPSGQDKSTYIIFLIPKDLNDYVVQYDTNSDCDIISWTVGNPITITIEFDITLDLPPEGEYEEGTFGYMVDYTEDPIKVTYIGDPAVVDTRFRLSLQGGVRQGELTEEEAQTIFKQCGGTGSVFDEVETEIPRPSADGLTEIEVESGMKEYYLIYYEAMIRPLSTEERELYNGYAAQYTEDFFGSWVQSNMEYAMEIATAISEGSMYTYVDGIWYVGVRQ
jgi:hypothetical protein